MDQIRVGSRAYSMGSLRYADVGYVFLQGLSKDAELETSMTLFAMKHTITKQKDRISRHQASPAAARCVRSRGSCLDRWLRHGDLCLEEVLTEGNYLLFALGKSRYDSNG